MPAVELLGLEETSLEETTRGVDGVEYAIEVRVTRDPDDASRLRVSGSVSEAAWGSPHDQLAESFTIELPTG
ncbi:hypothetical protein [Posidoniimonas polymericola]|nr:hypothetical protein [Posidoniimonas polymericola]